MSKITIICLGKFKEKAYKDLEKEFLKRLTPFSKISVIELSEEPYRQNSDIEKAQVKEAEQIRKRIPDNSIVILLEESGSLRSSEQFATFLDRISSLGQEICFVLGSSTGLHNSLNSVSNYRMSLSELTFPHNLARIILLEQIYRAFTIISGKNYHK